MRNRFFTLILSVGLPVVVTACGSSDDVGFGASGGDSGAASTGTAGSSATAGSGGTSITGGNAGNGEGGASAMGGSGGTGVGGAAGGDAAANSAGGSDASANSAPDSSFLPEGAVTCGPGAECTGFPTSGFPRDATAVSNCAGMSHRTDCCGALRVFGINHGSRTTLCPAETTCRAQYPAPSCTSNTITTDTGETTTTLDQVRVRCTDPNGGTCTCQTFVCTTDACRASSVAVGSCG